MLNIESELLKSNKIRRREARVEIKVGSGGPEESWRKELVPAEEQSGPAE